jgi:hypothetical protein
MSIVEEVLGGIMGLKLISHRRNLIRETRTMWKQTSLGITILLSEA